MSVKAYGAYAGDKPLESMDITRRAPGPHDVQIDIAFCGVCHSDLHQVRAEWAGTLGDPTTATAEKGRQLFDAAVKSLMGVIRRYHAGEYEDSRVCRKDI